ncbi:preprotein translocase secY subunit, partial [mine drainage metagenome]
MDKVERNRRVVYPTALVFILTVFAFYYFGHYNWLQLLIAAVLIFPLFGIAYLVFSYKGPGKSKLYGLEHLTSLLPAVKKPKGHVQFKYKIMWTALVVLLYFVLTNIYIYGLDAAKTIDVFASFRAIFAGAQGSLMDLGIGPIVTAS